jgi:hypothetical protein
VIWSHATVANTTKWQSVNCNAKTSLTPFIYFCSVTLIHGTGGRRLMSKSKFKHAVRIPYLPTYSYGKLLCDKPFTGPINEILYCTQHINMPWITFLFGFLCDTVCILDWIVPMVR